MREFARFAAKRAVSIFVVLLAAAMLAGGSWAATGSSEPEAPEVTESEAPEASEPAETPDGETEEKTVERYHGEDCTLATGLEGNWTHGDYVSAVAQDDDEATNVRDAAHSRCGKPLHAGKDGEKKEKPNKPEWAGKGGRSAEHRKDGNAS